MTVMSSVAESMPVTAAEAGRHGGDTPSPRAEILTAARVQLQPGAGAWRSRGAASWVAMWTLSGCGAVRQGQVHVAARPATLVLLGSAMPHEYEVDAEHDHWEMWWCHFQPRDGWLTWLAPFARAPRVYVLGPVPTAVIGDVTDIWRRLHVYLRWSGTEPLPEPEQPARERGRPAGSHRAGGHELALSVLEEILLVTMSTVRADTDEEDPVDTRVRRVLELVDADPGAPHSIESLAREVALSPSRLAHLFAQHIDRSPLAVVRTIRLQYAARLLAGTSLTVAQVASAAGFASPYHFSRTFRAEFGTPPSRYRTTGTDRAGPAG